MYSVLFLGEGSSDEAITQHVERIAGECGVLIATTTPSLELIDLSDRSVAGKLATVKKIGGRYDMLVIHRDADRDGRAARVEEIESAVQAVLPETNFACVIPVRMTEAWLILDEVEIRTVAGNPNGRGRLDVPRVATAERIADPKALLRTLLAEASELSGRRLVRFNRDFPMRDRRASRLRPGERYLLDPAIAASTGRPTPHGPGGEGTLPFV